MFSAVWWTGALLIGVWLGRRAEASPPIARLLATARTQTTLPELRPGVTILNRLWSLLVHDARLGDRERLPAAGRRGGRRLPDHPGRSRCAARRRPCPPSSSATPRASTSTRTSPLHPIRLVRTPGFGGAFLRHPVQLSGRVCVSFANFFDGSCVGDLVGWLRRRGGRLRCRSAVLGQVVQRVGAGVDEDPHAGLGGRAGVDAVEVGAAWATCRSSIIVPAPAAASTTRSIFSPQGLVLDSFAAGWAPDGVDERVLDRCDQPVGSIFFELIPNEVWTR